jgi:glycine amidinotransferase
MNSEPSPGGLLQKEALTVSSHNEWDPLEEVIVGDIWGATVPEWHPALKATMPRHAWPMFQNGGGRPFPPQIVEAAARELDELAELLAAEGVVVRRPQRTDFGRPFSTPNWRSPGGLYAAMPRDLLLVVGNEIIETPMAWRSRYFEIEAFRPLLNEYFEGGARWSAAPKPMLLDGLFDDDFEEPASFDDMRYVIGEDEPVFDAADFIRLGRDIFYIRSHVTNQKGANWLQRHLGDDYRLHALECVDTHPMHIDTSFLPLAPGKLLINPERCRRLPDYFRHWDVLTAPPPCTSDPTDLYMAGPWLSMNVLSLDGRRVVVARHETNMIAALKDWGFEPLTCAFENFYRFGGSIHCATLDVRRHGDLRSY